MKMKLTPDMENPGFLLSAPGEFQGELIFRGKLLNNQLFIYS
ncbi:hypothetical protein DCCM_4732 [Desulfocucumis palustris]|uniref:Uncharacterized protein n=1 Tax=Desulfocucumis palustris TaxID=1898651 RepID=A0A2L2XIS3_9FIRM|nr:hypothetical protein DCCM_4732 [Desulfocucumis palustris]